MGKKSKTPEQPTTKADMGMFGSTTSGKFGSTWNPTAFQTQFVNNAQDMMTNAQNALMNPEISQARVDDFNRQQTSNFQNNLLMPALNKGLLRGSTAQDVMSVAQRNNANAYQQMLDAEEQRNYQRLSNAWGNYAGIYDMAKGTTGLSNTANQAAAQYALNKAQIDAASNQALYNTIAKGVGTAVGAAAMFSDKRLKENIKKLDEIDGYNIYEFNYKGNKERQVGVIAQEIIGMIPEAVITGDDGYYRVDYSKLPKEVQERIEELNNV